MKIAIIGANGRVGSRIALEAAKRQHEVTAIVRNAANITDPTFKVIEKDIFSLTSKDLEPFEVIVNAFGTSANMHHLFTETARYLASVLRGKQVPRLLIVGGAGSLLVDQQGTELLATPGFPEEYKTVLLQCGMN